MWLVPSWRGSGRVLCCPGGSRARLCAAGSLPAAGTRGPASRYGPLFAAASGEGMGKRKDGDKRTEDGEEEE